MSTCLATVWFLLGMLPSHSLRWLLEFNSIQFYLYSAKSQQKSSQGTFHMEQVKTKLLNLQRERPNNSPHEQHLATAVRKNSPLTGRNLKQNPALGGRPSALTGWCTGRHVHVQAGRCTWHAHTPSM